jgi:hypothetical protein
MQWTDQVGHLNLSAVFTHRVFKSELIGLTVEILLLLALNPFFTASHTELPDS